MTSIKFARFLMALICVLICLNSGSLPVAQAAVSQVVLSNVPQVGFSSSYNSNFFDVGTRFSVPAGINYTLDRVSVQLVGSSASFSAFLYDTPGALPGTLVSQIGGTVTVNATGAGAVTPFVASVPITLQANHTYMVVLTGTGNYGLTVNLPTGIFTFQSSALYDRTGLTWTSVPMLSLALSIEATPQLPPTASFTFLRTGLSVAFTDTSTEAPNAWTWDFGDSSTSTAQNPTHIYPAYNTYNVCLTASNAYGISNQTCQQVIVSTPTLTPTATNTLVPPHPDTIGVYKDGAWYLRNSNTSGTQDIYATYGGDPTDLPVVGDWNGDGIDTLGIYRVSEGRFYLSDSNTGPAPTHVVVLFGNPADTPFSGKWTVDMTGDGIGVYRNSNGILYQRKSLTSGFNDFFAIFGNPGDLGFAGDWDGNGFDSIGIYRSSNQIWYLTNNSTPSGITFSEIDFVWDIANEHPVIGDWDGVGGSTVGYLTSSGVFALYATAASAGATNVFAFGPVNGRPVAGKWLSSSKPSLSQMLFSTQSGNTNSDLGGSGD